MSIKEVVTGAVITLAIGGGAYTINQTDVISNFASDTGMSQQQAEEYIKGMKEEDLATFGEIAKEKLDAGQELKVNTADVDCATYEYEWQSPTLSCEQGKAQLDDLANDLIALGQAFEKLGSDSGSREDIAATIRLLDELNADYEHEVVKNMLNPSDINTDRQSNSYNKALLKTALESE